MWGELQELNRKAQSRQILSLFDADPHRASSFSATAGDLLLDYSKTQIDAPIRDALLKLCSDADLTGARDGMFQGDRINRTEDRAVLHTALRNLDGGPVLVDGQDVMPDVLHTLERMRSFALAVREGTHISAGGRITDVVNIGIGGSDLGPAMAVQALAPYHDGPRCHFISNVDGADVTDTLAGLDPKSTLLIVASKTFTTTETMTNANTARTWLVQGGGDPARQMAALSSALDQTAAFGILDAHVFGFEDWVGGRYSLWGPIGLSLMIAIGPDRFDAFLCGAQTVDQHFRTTQPKDNLPVMLALSGLWHRQVCGHASRAVLPYDQRLLRLPAYLQQLEMESNGKSVRMDGTSLEGPSGPIVWGEPGTNGQHAFYQLIHQGTETVPCEFLIAARGHEPDLHQHHRQLVANCLAQSEALMRGRSLQEAQARMAARGLTGDDLEIQARHRVFPGNRPSVTLAYPQLSPSVLGQIIATYEHRVFVEGVILGINSFDQWGVELGKELANSLAPVLDSGDASGRDGSTAALVDYVRAQR